MRHQDNCELVPSNQGDQRLLSVVPNSASVGLEYRDFTWESVIRVLRKNVIFGLVFGAILTGLFVLYALLQRDFYRPTARLEIAPPGSGINTLQEIGPATTAENQDYLETQVQILGSDALAVSVIRELHLGQNPEYVGSLKAIKAKAGAEALEQPGNHPQPAQISILQEQLDLATLTPAENAALETFRKRLSVSSVRNTRLVEISFSANDPVSAQRITNTLVEKFIDQNYKHRYTTTMQASEWLSSQLEDLRKKVEDSTQAVAEFQKKYELVDVDDRDVPMSQLMNDISRQLSEAQATRIEDEAYVRMVDEGHSEDIPAVRDGKVYQDLMTRYADLRTQLAQAKTVYGDANVNVQKLQDQLTELSTQIDAERNRSIARARTAYEAARQTEKLLLEEREHLLSGMAGQSSQLAAFHMLKQEANANASLYTMLQGRLREAGIYAGLRSSNIRVVDMATNLHKPTGPYRSAIIALGTLGGLVFTTVLCFARETFRNTIRTPDDVRSWAGLPSLALLPAMHPSSLSSEIEADISRKLIWSTSSRESHKSKVEIMKTLTAESEAIRDLRTALLHGCQGDSPKVFLISSSMEGEGKTTVAVNFAIALAQLGRTCLLDGDLRRPTLARVFKLESCGLLPQMLEGEISLPEALYAVPGVENLSVLPSGTVSGNPADMLCSPQMKALLNKLKKDFMFVVIDSPPIIRFSDARCLSSLVDEVVLVGRYGVTTRRALQRTTEILGEIRASVAGVVLNGIDLASPDYDYYTYGYTRGRNKRGDQYQPYRPEGPGPSGDPPARAIGAHA